MKLKEFFKDEEETFEMPKWAYTFIFFVVWTVILNVLAVIYIKNSKFIYFWDNATYWDISRSIANGVLLPDIFKSIYNSIGNMDYNYVAGLMSAIFIKIFGESRLVYVLTLVNLYLVPSIILIYQISKKLGKAPKITTSLIMLLVPAITFMAFIGFADIGGLIGGLGVFDLYYDNDKKGKQPLRYVVIGIILVCMMLYRRWYAFFAVSFITAMISDCIVNKRKWYYPVITIAVSGALLFLGFKDFTFNILLRDYGTLYSGYKFSVATDLKLITRYFGIIYMLVIAVASGFIVIKKHDLRPLFSWVQIIVCAVMFMMTQTHGQQHLILYMPSFIVLTIIVIRYINKEWMLLSLAALAIADAVNVCIPYKQVDNIQDIKWFSLVPSFSILPRIRDDAMEMLNLKQRLDTVICEGETLGVLSSSFVLNEDVLRNAEPSLGYKKQREDYIVSLPQVDSRDSDIRIYGDLNYVLAVTPPQTHLADGEQRIVEEAVTSFINWTDIATAYEEIYDFYTEINGMEIKLYKRVREIPEYSYNEFLDRLK